MVSVKVDHLVCSFSFSSGTEASVCELPAVSLATLHHETSKILDTVPCARDELAAIQNGELLELEDEVHGQGQINLVDGACLDLKCIDIDIVFILLFNFFVYTCSSSLFPDIFSGHTKS